MADKKPEDNNLIKCPECFSKALHYDDFEDMYYCHNCRMFWYPDQVNAKENKSAGYLTFLNEDVNEDVNTNV